MNSLATDLSKLSAREHRLLDQCKDLFSTTFIPLQVRMHVIALHQASTSLHASSLDSFAVENLLITPNKKSPVGLTQAVMAGEELELDSSSIASSMFWEKLLRESVTC